MKQGLSFLLSHLCVCITEDEPYGGKEVALPRSIVTNNDIVLWREGLHDRLVFVARINIRWADAPLIDDSPFEALDDNLLDVHGDRLPTPRVVTPNMFALILFLSNIVVELRRQVNLVKQSSTHGVLRASRLTRLYLGREL